MTANAQHSSVHVSHFTPARYVEAARALLGGIELDPASCATANRTVRARRFYTEQDDALRLGCDWTAETLFLNPPGKPKGAPRSLARPFWRRLVREHRAGRVGSAVFIAFSIEMFQNFQVDAGPDDLFPTHFPFCIPRERIAFESPIEQRVSLQTPLFGGSDDDALCSEEVESGESPTHANAIVYLPPFVPIGWDLNEPFRQFVKHFGPIGHCVNPR